MDAVFLQAVLTVFRDGDWHPIREAFAQAGREYHTRDARSDAVKWIRKHTITDGEGRGAHFQSQPPTGVFEGRVGRYCLTKTGVSRLEDILRQKLRVSPSGHDHRILLSFLSLHPGTPFSSADLSMAVFKGKVMAHRVTTLLRELRQQGYLIVDEPDPSNGKRRLFRFVRMIPVIKKLSLDNVIEDLLNIGIKQNGFLSVDDVRTHCAFGDRNKAISLLRDFSERMNLRIPNSCRKITSKSRKGALIRIEFATDIPRSLVLAPRLEPRARLPKGYALCAKQIIANGGVLPYLEFLAFARDVCGHAHAAIFGCRMVKDGYLVKDKADVQLKNTVKKRITHVRLPDDFPMHLLDAPEEPAPVCASPLVAAETRLEYCTDRFGYSTADMPDQPVNQFKMWVREIVDGLAGAPRVKIQSMYTDKGLWSPELTEVVMPATVELARAVCHLLEQHVESLVGKHVRLGAPEDRAVLMQAMEYGFVPYLLTLPKDQRLTQSIAWLHLPTRAFRTLYAQNGIRDIGGLIRARESGTALAGIGVGNLALVDNAIAMFITGNGDTRDRSAFLAQQPACKIDACRIAR